LWLELLAMVIRAHYKKVRESTIPNGLKWNRPGTVIKDDEGALRKR
jgi:hypothetical protein